MTLKGRYCSGDGVVDLSSFILMESCTLSCLAPETEYEVVVSDVIVLTSEQFRAIERVLEYDRAS